MSRLSNIRSAASSVKESIAGTLSRGGDDDNLGPDRGTMDQLKARKERARIEARREAQREQRQEEVEDVREEAREEVQSSEGGVLSRAASAVEAVADDIDIDGDGTPLAQELADDGTGSFADEFGGEASGGAPAAIEADLAALEADVNEHDQEINQLESEVFGDGADERAQDPLGAGFDAAGQLGYDNGGEF